MMTCDYAHMDVFTASPLSGNGLAVVFCDAFPDAARMLALAREFKQFETIFLCGYAGDRVHARIFTMEGELPFAGHPTLGGVAALHGRHRPTQAQLSLDVLLPDKRVRTTSRLAPHGWHVEMCQGEAAFGPPLDVARLPWVLDAHGLRQEDLDPRVPPQVVSTGLPYLLVPVRGDALARARITVRDLQARLAQIGAAYSYLFNVSDLEARTWDNLGLVEDSATGSAAGPACAWLVRHGMAGAGQTLAIRQGRHAGSPGEIFARVQGGQVYVAGDVVCFARGSFTV